MFSPPSLSVNESQLFSLVPVQPKGADRKQKTDREKMEKRTAQEKEKYQPSYDTTILSEVSVRRKPYFCESKSRLIPVEVAPFQSGSVKAYNFNT